MVETSEAVAKIESAAKNSFFVKLLGFLKMYIWAGEKRQWLRALVL